MSEGIKIESDKRTQIEAKVIEGGFLDQGFINTMRFSELNGPEEYDNTHLYIDWHACFEYGLQQIRDWRNWIFQIYKAKDSAEWASVPEWQKQNIERILKDIAAYDASKPCDDKGNIKTIRNNLSKYNWNLACGIYIYDGHVGLLNGRMARDKGHKKDLLKVTENRKDREREIEMGQNKQHWYDLRKS